MMPEGSRNTQERRTSLMDAKDAIQTVRHHQIDDKIWIISRN